MSIHREEALPKVDAVFAEVTRFHWPIRATVL